MQKGKEKHKLQSSMFTMLHLVKDLSAVHVLECDTLSLRCRALDRMQLLCAE